MSRIFTLCFGIFCYIVFLVTFLYQVGFVAGVAVPKDIDDGVVLPAGQAIAVNLVLLSLFAIQHTIMSRLVFKRWWTRLIPPAIERSVFVLVASLLLLLLNWQWKPLPEPVWHVASVPLRGLLYVLAAGGWGLVLYSTFLINHFDLFGLRQVWLYYQGRAYTPVKFKEAWAYQWLRHPLMLGFITAFWATPDMSQGRLLFAVVTTLYILIAIRIEEQTLLAIHGEDYRDYQQRVSMIIPRPPRPKVSRASQTSAR